MNPQFVRRAPRTLGLAALALVATLVLSACGSSSSDTKPASVAPYGPSVSMNFPDSLTGGASTTTASTGYATMAASGGPSCNFAGAGSGDPFRNGYVMTKFLVANVATWQCFTDFLMSFVTQVVAAGTVPTDGTFVAIPPDPTDPEAPTGIRITAGSTSNTVELYWGTSNSTNAGVYFAWSDDGAGNIAGRLILDASIFNPATNSDGSPNLNYDPEAPTAMRMDLNYNTTTQHADMYLAFDPSGNQWATAFRVSADKTVADGSFVILGRIDMKKQWDQTYAYSDVPSLEMYTVSDSTGMGAAIATMANQGIHLGPVDDGDDLGSFLFNKDDTYYFTAAGAGEYINKNVTSALYRGGQSINGTGNVRSAASVDTFLSSVIGSATTMYSDCTASADGSGVLPGSGVTACATFLNTLFSGGDFGAEANYGTEPTDGRATQIAAATYLSGVCPDGTSTCTWDTTDVFAHVFP